MKLRLAVALVFIVGTFVAIANLAVVWHGGLFVLAVPVWAYGANRAFDWARRPAA